MNFKIYAEATTERQLTELLKNEVVSKVFADFNLVEKFKVPAHLKQKIVIIPPLFLGGYSSSDILSRFEKIKNTGFQNANANTFEQMEFLKQVGFKTIHGGWRLNVVNKNSLNFFTENGLVDLILSPELNSKKHLSSDIPLGFLAYGHLPSVVRCVSGNRIKSFKDRKDVILPVRNFEKYFEVLNSNPIWLADKLECFSHFQIAYFLFSSNDNTARILKSYISKSTSNKKFTRGSYFKSVL